MGILMASTTISVWEPSLPDENELRTPNSASLSANLVKKTSGIRAHISGPGGAEIIAAGGEQANLSFRFVCDPCDINHLDIVQDEKTGKKYEVQWVSRLNPLGMDHMTGALVVNEGSEYSS